MVTHSNSSEVQVSAQPSETLLRCRFCNSRLQHSFVDLGASPLANSYVPVDRLLEPEPFYSLHAFVCDACHLVQLPQVAVREAIFNADYTYFSSYSQSVLDHARSYVDLMVERHGIDARKTVVEIASNDGYLLKYFRDRGVTVLGIEPSASVANVAIRDGIPSRIEFFGVDCARRLVSEGIRADLLLGNNVLAHVPDINDFVAGMRIVLAPDGFVTVEFPHLMQLMHNNYYDTIYHEHFSYLSLMSAEQIFAHHGLTVFDVEEIAPQGGSLRLYVAPREADRPVSARVGALRDREIADGVTSIDRYRAFADTVHASKRELLKFLIAAKEAGKTVVGYGAPAKGNTLLNFCGVKTDLLAYTVDRNPHKQNHLLPGTRIPIQHPSMIEQTRPDYVLILPWNIRDEVMRQMAVVRDWGGRFVVPLPKVEVLE